MNIILFAYITSILYAILNGYYIATAIIIATIPVIDLDVTNGNYRDAGIATRKDGGRGEEIFKLFGIKDTQVDTPFNFIKNILSKQEEWENYIIYGGTKGNADTDFLNKELNIAEKHAYRISPYTNEYGDIIITVTNPWNTSNSVDLTLKQFYDYFNQLTYSKVKEG